MVLDRTNRRMPTRGEADSALPEDAEEAAQEALTRAWRPTFKLPPGDAASAWVAQIGPNEALRLLARDKSQRALFEPIDPGMATSPIALEACGAMSADRIIARIDMERALKELTPRDRALIDLRYGAGVAQTRIADALAVPEASVRVRLHRIRRRLQDTIGEAA
jgi:RNA polymerase sigma-70 factor (ECF subfamily)